MATTHGAGLSVVEVLLMAIPGKNSFLLFHDMRSVFEDLSDEQRGKLILHLFDYSENSTIPEIKDPLLKMAFNVNRAAIDRSAAKYKKVVERNRENGKAGGRPRKKTQWVIKNPAGY